jgi:afadin
MHAMDNSQESVEFKRKLSKREKKELKKKEKESKLSGKENESPNKSTAKELYTAVPETSFTRSISNPEAVMRRRRQQKLEKKLHDLRNKADGGEQQFLTV